MEIGFENSALETRQRRTERTQYKMQIPENYGYVVLAIAAMGIPNVVAVVRVIKARSKYGVKYPNLYAPEVLFYITFNLGKGGEFCHVALMCLCGIQSLSLCLSFPFVALRIIYIIISIIIIICCCCCCCCCCFPE